MPPLERNLIRTLFGKRTERAKLPFFRKYAAGIAFEGGVMTLDWLQARKYLLICEKTNLQTFTPRLQHHKMR
jgi:hypothetical protein